jgi:outer membrane protein assembly factor BamB
VIGLSLADGRLLWEIPFVTDYEQNSVTPLVVKDLVIYAGLNKPATAARLSVVAGKWQVSPVWQNPDLPMYMSTPVESGGYLFGLTNRNRGQFFCLDIATGKTTWTTKGREAENATFLTAGPLVMAMTTEGELVVLRSNSQAFEPVKRYTLAESPVWAHPALVGGGIVVKDLDTLAYWVF